MAEYAGSALYLEWIYASGTVVLSGDSRTFATTPAIDNYMATAGSDTHHSYIAGVKDHTITVTLVAQTDGTVLYDALEQGTSGTVRVSPEGTASGKRQETYPALSNGITRNEPYNDVVTYNITWQGNGAPTKTTAW